MKKIESKKSRETVPLSAYSHLHTDTYRNPTVRIILDSKVFDVYVLLTLLEREIESMLFQCNSVNIYFWTKPTFCQKGSQNLVRHFLYNHDYFEEY
jgi:hypothetical protein